MQAHRLSQWQRSVGISRQCRILSNTLRLNFMNDYMLSVCVWTVNTEHTIPSENQWNIKSLFFRIKFAPRLHVDYLFMKSFRWTKLYVRNESSGSPFILRQRISQRN